MKSWRYITSVLIASSLIIITACGTEQESKTAETSTNSAPSHQEVLPEYQPGESNSTDPASIIINGAKTRIHPVGLLNNSFVPPDDNIDEISWYQDSAVPGSRNQGTIVLTGHVNYQGKDGYADKFTSLKEGDIVTIINQNNKSFNYRVKNKPLLVTKSDRNAFRDIGEKTFNRSTGPETLILITCMGKFIGGPLGYESNGIIEATPIKEGK